MWPNEQLSQCMSNLEEGKCVPGKSCCRYRNHFRDVHHTWSFRRCVAALHTTLCKIQCLQHHVSHACVHASFTSQSRGLQMLCVANLGHGQAMPFACNLEAHTQSHLLLVLGQLGNDGMTKQHAAPKHGIFTILQVSQTDTWNMTQNVRPTHTCCRSLGSCTPLRCSCCGGSSLARRPGAAEAGSGRCSTAMLSTASDKGSHALRTDLSTVRASGCISMRSDTCTAVFQLVPAATAAAAGVVPCKGTCLGAAASAACDSCCPVSW